MRDYATSGAVGNTLTSYLTSSDAKTFYQPLAGMGSYVTVNDAVTFYQPIKNMSTYVTSASIANTLNSYLTSSGATSIYQPIGSYVTIGSSLLVDVDNYQVAGNYLTTFTPLTGAYLSKIDANTTLGSYLTSSGASSLYQPKDSYQSV